MSRVTKGHQLLSACRRLSSARLTEPVQRHAVPQSRVFSDAVASVRQARPSLDKPAAGLDNASESFCVPHKETRISTLENGMKIATENSYGQFVTVGFFARVGPRFDDGFTPGISHVLEKMAFQGSAKYPSRNDIVAELDPFGGLVDCQFHREVGMYTMSVLANGLEKAMEILADVTLQPLLTDEHLVAAQVGTEFHIQDLDMQANQDPRLSDIIHKAAFGESGLGLPRLCPDGSIRSIKCEEIARYLQAKMQPENLTLAAVNVDHQEFEALAKKYFSLEEPSWSKLVSGAPSSVQAQSPAVYKAGIVRDERKMERAVVHENQLPDVAHYALAYKSCSYKDEDFVPTCVLNTLVGGGSSFSAGGPGKGLFSRFYMNVLSHHHFVMSAIATNHPYADTGLFTFTGSCSPPQLGKLAEVLSAEVGRLARDPFSTEEVSRAKQQLLSLLFMNLESRVINLEDIGRQVLELGLRESGQQLRQKILDVTVEDVARVARGLFNHPPSFAALGDIDALPSYDRLKQIAHESTQPKQSSFPFRFSKSV